MACVIWFYLRNFHLSGLYHKCPHNRRSAQTNKSITNERHDYGLLRLSSLHIAASWYFISFCSLNRQTRTIFRNETKVSRLRLNKLDKPGAVQIRLIPVSPSRQQTSIDEEGSLFLDIKLRFWTRNKNQITLLSPFCFWSVNDHEFYTVWQKVAGHALLIDNENVCLVSDPIFLHC